MRRTLISSKGFTAPRSSTSTTTEAAALPRPSSNGRPSAVTLATRGASQNKTSAVGADRHAEALPNAQERHSTGKKATRKRPRSSLAVSSSQPSLLAEGSPSVSASLHATPNTDTATPAHIASQTESEAQGQPAKKKKKKNEKTETRMSEVDDEEEEADLAVSRSRRLHNGDVIAFAAPPPKNLALPGTPRGLHHRSGHGERRQVVYPDPVIPSASPLYNEQARVNSALAESALLATSNRYVTERHVGNDTDVPEALLPTSHEPPFRSAPEMNTPLRVVTYPANDQGRVAEGELSPEIALPSSSQAAAAALGFAFADAIASAASSMAPHSTADGRSPSDNDTPTHVSATSPSPHSQGPSCASAINLAAEVRLSGGDGALDVGAVEASFPSSSASCLSVSTAIAVHQQAFLRAMLDATPDAPTTPSPLSSVSPSLDVGWSGPRAAMESPQHIRVMAPHTTSMSALTPATPSAEFPPPCHDEPSLTAPPQRVVMWEPSAAFASTPAPRRRTMISLAKPKPNLTTNTPPSEATAETSAATREMTRVDEEGEEGPHSRTHTPEVSRHASAEKSREPFPRHPSADSALLLTDPDEDDHAGGAQGDDNALNANEDDAQDETISGENSKSVPAAAAAAAADDEEETRRNQALDREVEEDLRLSEDLPFTPSGFYASTPFTAHRLTQEDDANIVTGDGDAREMTSAAVGAFRDERLAGTDEIMEAAPDTRRSPSATSGPQRSLLSEPRDSFPCARAAPHRVGLVSAVDDPLCAPEHALTINTGNVADTHPHLPALFAHTVVAPGAGMSAGSHTRTTFRFAPQVSVNAPNEEELRAEHQPTQPQPPPQPQPLHTDDKSDAREQASSPTAPSTAAGLTEVLSRDAEASLQSNPPPTERDPAAVAPLLLPPLSAHGGPVTPITPHTHSALTSGEECTSEPTSGLRPKRTLFCFGAPPPVRASPAPVSTSMNSPPQSVSPSHASASSRPPDERYTRNSMTVTEPVGAAAAAAAAAAAGAASIISADPTEMFTEEGDSVSVPVPPQRDEAQTTMTPADPGRHHPEPMMNTPTRSSPLSPSPTAGTATDPFYGLPGHVFTLFMRQRRITQFYAWQHEVLTSPDLLRGRHFVYSLPTSGGKTLVAEVALLRCLVNRQQSCFFVLPFVSLAEEKTTALQPLGDALGFRVEGHYGFTGRFPLPAGPTVYVCTIEKANSVLSYLLEEGRALAELGLVVVDELHMLGESRRGATLEVLLSKLLLLRTRQEERQQQQQQQREITTRAEPRGVASSLPEQALVQIVGMSATVPNLNVIARWLDAACYEGTYRPVPLHQYSVFDGMVLRDGERNERNLNGRNEIEQLLELATELADGSVLVFCASRQQCVDTARGVVRYMQHTTMRHTAADAMTASASAAPPGQPGTTPTRGQSPFRGGVEAPVSRSVALGAQPPQTAAALQALLNELQSLSYGQADQLCDLVPYGVAYHHGGLLAEERELIESAYRDRHLRILCCTSTLAAGVNLPARRVIFKSPYTGREFLTKSRYLQMCGRAGRAGMDAYGESFLVLNRRDRQRGLRLMRDPLEPCESQLLEEHSQFVRSLLECISVGLVSSMPDGVAAWGGSLFCGHALGALDVVTTTDLWRQHGSLWGRAELASLAPASDACEPASEAVPPSAEATRTAAASLTPITRGIQLLHPDIAPPSKTALTAAETRAIRAAFVTQPQPCLTMLLGAAVEELLMHGFIETTARETTQPMSPNEEADATGGTALTTTPPPLRLSATPFGTSSVRSCFSVESALLVRKELDEMLHMGLILADDLHLCYFLTPLREIPEDCDWVLYRSILARLSDSRQRIAGLIGLNEFYIDQRAMGLAGSKAHIATSEDARRQSFTARRFWVALILADVLAEVPLPDVVARYGVNRGMLQDVMRSAAMFSSSITSFCHAMGWYSLEAVLASFVKRLGFGVKPDIVPLMDMRGVQPSRARALWNAGYKDPARVAAGDPDEMVTRVKESNPPDSKSAKFFTKRSALMVIREASLLLENQIREKRGELKELTARTAL